MDDTASQQYQEKKVDSETFHLLSAPINEGKTVVVENMRDKETPESSRLKWRIIVRLSTRLELAEKKMKEEISRLRNKKKT